MTPSTRRSAPFARKFFVLVATCLLSLSGTTAFAQDFQLSPAQQQMLNSLPPAQRQQAMDALRQLQSQQSATTQQSINEPIEQSTDRIRTKDFDQVLSSTESTAQARSRLVINFKPIDILDSNQQRKLSEDAVLQKLIGSHHFVLDNSGVLSLQGLERIQLLGLTQADINRRLAAEPYLALFDIDARILGQESIGVEGLEPFGYDVFAPREGTLVAPDSGPVPPDYVLGPGDSVRVQLFGNVNGIYEYEVSRDGILNLPEIGPVTVAGIPFSEFRADLDARVKEMLIGTQVSVTMGPLRTIRVFVLGDVNRPGSYVVSGLSTMAGALYRSGGVSSIGSLRRIQLKRNGRLVTTLDAYDLLINGDTFGDQRLQPGDVIFVPPVGGTVAISGAVRRPAIYETNGRASVADVVKLAGGLTAEAFGRGARIERIDANKDRTVLAVNLTSDDAKSIAVQTGDTLLIPEVLPEIDNAVMLSGHVHRPGGRPWRSGMRLTDLIATTDELKSGVDTHYLLIRREIERGQPLQVLSANLAAALSNPIGPENIRLESRDTVHVFSLSLGRQRVVGPLIEELELQSSFDAPSRRVEISGNVRAPGIYPLESQMHVSDLVRAGGNLSEAAYALEAELTRYSVGANGTRNTEVIDINLDAIRQGDEAADLLLREHDYLIINRSPEWDTTWTVSLEGEVKFPGKYRVRRGECLADVVRRAGGLTSAAFAEGAVFLRDTLRKQEQEQLETLARRLEADLVSLSVQSSNSGGSDTLATGNALLDQLRNSEAVGRLVIDLEHAVRDSNGTTATIEMRDGDKLLVPTYSQMVTVLGETQQNTSHLYQEEMSRDDYIDLSGGLTRRADKKLIYVVRANGAVVAGNRSRWFGRGNKFDIRPGDTIVIPLDTDRMRPMTFWTNVTQMLYQGAIAVAAVKTFDN